MSLARGGELKLELTREELLRVRSHPVLGGLAVGEPVTRTTRSIYFDTPDHRLRSLGFFVRLCSEGDGWLQTIGAGDSPTAVSCRLRNAHTAVPGPQPDVSAIASGRIRRTLKKVLKRSTLAPVFETVVDRTTRDLRAGGADIQLALDEGVVRAGNAEGCVYEAELELRSGSASGLLDTATRLFAENPVRLAESSATDRGYWLARGEPVPGNRPRLADPPELRSDQTCGDVLTLLVQASADQIASSRIAVLASEAPAAAHQLRIGLRRLRSALAAFRPIADDPWLSDLEAQARTLARSVGALRDADVLIDDICAPVAAAMRGDRGFVELNDVLAAHREDVRLRVRSELSGLPWSMLQLKLGLCRSSSEAEALQVRIGGFARAAMKRRWRKVAVSGQRLDELSIEERHAMRKALKQLRYTAEFFAGLYAPRPTRRFIKQVRSLQEVFGYLNDVAAAERLTAICHAARADSPEVQRAAGYVLGWHNAQAARAWKDAHAGWQKLAAMPRFWG